MKAFPSKSYDLFCRIEHASVFNIVKRNIGRLFVDKCFFKDFLVVIVPILFFSANMLSVAKAGTLLPVKGVKYSYLEDISNSVVLTILCFYSYFLSGHYCRLFHKIVDSKDVNALNKHRSNDKGIKSISVICILAFIALLLFMLHYFVDANIAKVCWYEELSSVGKCCYKICLGFTIYNTLNLTLLIILASMVIHSGISNKQFATIEFGQVDNDITRKIQNLLLYNISYGSFYIIGLLVITLNDYYDYTKNEIKKALAGGGESSLVIILGLIVVLLVCAFMYLPMVRYSNYINNQRNGLLRMCDEKICVASSLEEKAQLRQYSKELAQQKYIKSSLGNKISASLTVITPLLSLAIELMK